MEERSLHDQRLAFVNGLLRDAGARSVLDLGCGAGRLLAQLLGDETFETITGLDGSASALAVARGELAAHLESGRLQLLHGDITRVHPQAGETDATCLVEVIEHLEPGRLSAAETCIFGSYRSATVLVTTPNVEYNPIYGLRPGQTRDPDHRFEWPRERFRAWAAGVGRRNGYKVRCGGIGEPDPELGSPTQFALFRRS